MDTSFIESIMQFLAFVSVVVVLPISIVTIIYRSQQAMYQRKYDFLEKCIDNGIEIQPELLHELARPDKKSKISLKKKLLYRLVIGIAIMLVPSYLILQKTVNLLTNAHRFGCGFDWSFFFEFSSVEFLVLTVGLAMVIWYFVGKKFLAEELAEDEAERAAEKARQDELEKEHARTPSSEDNV